MSWFTGHVAGPAILIFTGAVISSAGAVWVLVQQADSERQLRAKSEEIAELNRTIAATVTGGDSFCYLNFYFKEGSPNLPFFVVTHSGKYPLYDLEILVLESAESQLTPERFEQGHLVNALKISTLPTHETRYMLTDPPLDLSKGDHHRYTAFIRSRNGMVVQDIRAERVGVRWEFAIRVWRDSQGQREVLFADASKGFPLGSGGNVEW